MCPANDINNWGGEYIIVGVEEKTVFLFYLLLTYNKAVWMPFKKN